MVKGARPILAVVIGFSTLAAAVSYFVVRGQMVPFGHSPLPRSDDVGRRGGTGGPVTKAGDSDTTGLAAYPDLPLAFLPPDPQSVQYIIEHRSALNQKRITVRGIVVSTAFQRSPPCTTGPCPMYAPASGVVLADTPGAARDKQYDLIVLLGDDTAENEKIYPIGKTVAIVIQVWGSKTAVLASKIMLTR